MAADLGMLRRRHQDPSGSFSTAFCCGLLWPAVAGLEGQSAAGLRTGHPNSDRAGGRWGSQKHMLWPVAVVLASGRQTRPLRLVPLHPIRHTSHKIRLHSNP